MHFDIMSVIISNMTIRERKERNDKIIKYKLDGHTFQETSDWAKKNFGLVSLNQIFFIWAQYQKTLR